VRGLRSDRSKISFLTTFHVNKMGSTTKLLLSKLNSLKEMGCCGIKVSFEDEGAQLNEVNTMRYITASLGLELTIKIGGCEAKRDVIDATHVCCDSIVAPMIESAFSLSKFLESADIVGAAMQRGINVETALATANLFDLEKKFDQISFVTFGRSDFVSSMGRERDYVDSIEVRNAAQSVLSAAKAKNISAQLGGTISVKSKDFIQYLINLDLLDKFETRHVVFDTQAFDMNRFNEAIGCATDFEIEWIRFVSARYAVLEKKDALRVRSLIGRSTVSS